VGFSARKSSFAILVLKPCFIKISNGSQVEINRSLLLLKKALGRVEKQPPKDNTRAAFLLLKPKENRLLLQQEETKHKFLNKAPMGKQTKY